ncbi:MAG: transposase [Candidatus Bathyarchaeota archaeon]|nr:transposase [Candidatus Bathyarchaeota archaeon]
MPSILLLRETCKFRVKPDAKQVIILEELFNSYTEMVKECLKRVISLGISSRKRLHEVIYKELRVKYSAYPSHYIYTAITQTLAIFKSYRRLYRKKKSVSLPRVENLNSILLDDTHLFWFNWGRLKLATHRGNVVLPFDVHVHSKKFRDWQVKGSRLVRKGSDFFLHATFKKAVEERKSEGVVGIDINEKSIDLAVVRPDKVRFIKIDVSEAKYIRDRYFKKRRRIQRKTSGQKKAELLAKYSGREKRRVNEVLQKASRFIANVIAEENVTPVMEVLTNIRERIRCNRSLNRRLHSLPFRRIQFCVSYKSMEQGLKPEHVKANNTSRTCPICGEFNKPNGHVFKCKKCRFYADRHLVAAWNIAMKLPMCRPLPLAAKVFNEPQVIEVRGKG